MGKPKRNLTGSKRDAVTQTILTLTLPDELLPPAADELRWAALRRHFQSNAHLCQAPHEGHFHVPAMHVPSSDFLAYARGDYDKLTNTFLFMRKVILLLVGNTDLLRSVVDTGSFVGADVINKYDAALDKVLAHSATRTKLPSEADNYTKILQELAMSRRIDAMRQRRRSICYGVLLVGMPLYVAWHLGYWSTADITGALGLDQPYQDGHF